MESLMKTSPNQRVVAVERTMPDKSKKQPYLYAYRSNIEAAARNLTPVAFKLYLYFISNQKDYIFAFSSAHFAETYGCDVKSAKTAFNKLEELGYLVLAEGCKNKYVFYEQPMKKAPTLPSAIGINLQKKKFKDADTGEVYEMTFKELLEACENNEEFAKQLWEAA